MICSILGAVATEPVVLPKLGAIFERKHLVDYINATGTDPVSGDAMTVDDIIAIAVTPTVPPLPHTLIPLLLLAFQTQWNATVLEMYLLRRQLADTRKQLSEQLYKNELYKRLCVEAMNRRDELEQAVNQLTAAMAESTGNDDSLRKRRKVDDGTTTTTVPKLEQATTEENGSNSQPEAAEAPADESDKPVASAEEMAQYAEEIEHARNELFTHHKQHKIKYDYGTLDGLPTAKQLHLPKAKFNVEIAAVHHNGKVDIVGDKSLEIYDVYADETTPVDVGGKYVFDLDSPVVASELEVVHNDHKLSIPNVHLVVRHPSESEVFVALNNDAATLVYQDKLLPNSYKPSAGELKCGAFHVDGGLFALGSLQGKVDVYNTITHQLAMTIDTSHPEVVDIGFGLNGYWMFALSRQPEGASVIDLVDLRKNKIVHTFIIDQAAQGLAIDDSCQILVAYGDSGLQGWRYNKKAKLWSDAFTNDSTYKTIGFTKTRLVGVKADATIDGYDLAEWKQDTN